MKVNYYILKLLSLFLVLLIVLSLTFLLLRLLPGGPFDKDKKLPIQIKQNIEKKYNLDKPLLIQYSNYMKNAMVGDFGMSYSYPNKTVKEIISESAEISIKIGTLSIIFTFLLTIFLSLYLFENNSMLANLLKNILFIFVGVPTFLIGAILILVFSVKFKLFNFGLVQNWSDFILPILTLSLPSISYLTNLLMDSMKDTKNKMYSRVARLNNIKKFHYLYHFIFKNSIIPLITALGPITAFMITGSFVVESIFAIPGTGKAFIFSIINRDYTLICGLTIFYTIILLIVNTVIDFIYPIIDKRVNKDAN